MMKLFPELRRPWSDGLVSALGIQDYRDPFEIRFGLFGDDDGGGGSDNVDRSNPNEMAAREKAAARAGTVTDSKGNAVTSVNPDGSRSVVTTGTQAQQVAAREAFNATDSRASDTRSNYAQDQYDQVAARETAALNRAAEAGRLASTSLANVGDITQPAAALGLDDELAFTQGMSGGQPPLTPEQQTARMMGEDPFARPQLTVAQRAALTTDQKIDDLAARNTAAIAAMNLTPEEQAEREAIAARQRAFVTGIATTPQAATAANVLGTSPSDMARIATADAAMDPSAVQVFDSSPNAMDAGDMMLNPGLSAGLGSLPTPGGTVRDLQAQRQLQGPPQLLAGSVMPERTYGDTTLGTSTTSFLDYPGTINDVNVYSTIDPATGRATSVASPLVGQGNVPMDSMDFGRQLNEQRLGLGDNAPQSATSAAVQQAAARQLSPLEQSIQAAVDASTRQFTPVSSPKLMGEQAAAGTPAEKFYTGAYRGRYPKVEGNIPGTTMAGIGNAIQEFSPIGAIVRGITGAPPLDLPSASEQAAFNSGQLLSMGGKMDEQTGAISGAKAGRGELNMNRFGMVTYSGMPDPSYDGPYANLVNPPEDTGGDGDQPMQQATADPCPEGYQMVDGVCQPVDDVTADDPAAPGSNFVINPTTGLPTLFQPTTQATQVGQIQPFVLQPNAPQQIAAPQGIQALSPTGAALGRQV
jgi:hypothetical protein